MPRPLVRSARLAALGAGCGALAGLASYVFLELLHLVTETRYAHNGLVWLLPVAGLLIGWVYDRWGGRARGGTALAVAEAHAYTRGSPLRMAPMVLAGTLLGHLFGASVGREGTAVQMSSALTDASARALRLDHDDRATLARAALAGGFGSVFGVPLAGIVFAMEVARRRTLRAVVASATAAVTGHLVVVGLGHDHGLRPDVRVPFGLGDVVLLCVFGWCCGLTARVFAASVPALRRTMVRHVPWAPLRPALGGVATLALALVVGTDYLGLSTFLVDLALLGDTRSPADVALKLLFTVIALGSGFVGGEVTPLFVTGGLLGSALADPLGLDPVATTAIGVVAVYGAAAHVPLACTVMAGELFGPHVLVAALLVCLVARATAARESIYAHPLARPEPAGAADVAGAGPPESPSERPGG